MDSFQVNSEALDDIQISRRILTIIQKFLTSRIAKLSHKTEKETDALLNQILPSPNESKLKEALSEINQRWNHATLDDLADYIQLDEIIYCTSDVEQGKVVKPFLFKRAQDLWDKNHLNKNYKIKLNDLKSEIRRHGTYSALILARDEAKKREELAREEKKKEALENEEERSHREQRQKQK